MSAYVEIVFDNSDGRFPVQDLLEYKTEGRLGRTRLFFDGLSV